MEFKITEIVEHSQDDVYRTYRDHLPDLVPDLPNVDSIEVLERTPKADGVKLLNEWKVSGAVPRAFRPLFSDKMMTYLDHADWVDSARRVDWRFEVGVAADAVDCRGTNYFREGDAPGTTEVLLTGRLAIDLKKVKGVPRFLGGLAPKLERFLLDRVRPNMVEVTRAVGTFLDRRGG